METMKTVVAFLLFGVMLWIGWKAFLPYWDKYTLAQIVGEAAQYGTIHGEVEARKKVLKLSGDAGWNFSEADFYVKKDIKNTVTIVLSYKDEVNVFGFTLWELDFKIEEVRTRVNF